MIINVYGEDFEFIEVEDLEFFQNKFDILRAACRLLNYDEFAYFSEFGDIEEFKDIYDRKYSVSSWTDDVSYFIEFFIKKDKIMKIKIFVDREIHEFDKSNIYMLIKKLDELMNRI